MARSRIALDSGLVVVTGAGSGIGAATAETFARRGATVVVVDVVAERVSSVVDRIGDLGAKAIGETCDVADSAAVKDLAARVIADHGVPHVVVNNAGVGISGHIDASGVEDWDWVRGINLDGVVYGTHAFGTAMLEEGRGQVVNTASCFAYTMRAAEAYYVATKAAVLAFSRSLRADWNRRGVGVTAICPGMINTAIAADARMVGDRDKMQDWAVKTFQRGHDPKLAAAVILDAVIRNRAVATVGWDAKLLYGLQRTTPMFVQDLVARLA